MGRGGSHPRAKGGPRQEAVPALWVVPRASLWSSGVFRRIKNLHKFSSSSENISRSKFSKIQKQQKLETGTRHLVNRLVQQNA